MNKHSLLFYFRVGLSLMLIAAAVGALLAVVHAVTADRIAEQEEAKMTSAISRIFGEIDEPILLDTPVSAPVSALYRIEKGGSPVGYCAAASALGFKDAVSLMVGTDKDGKVIGIQIVSSSETPGIGSKATSDSHLSAYTGKSGSVALGTDVHAVSGATVTSKAVNEAVSGALSRIAALLGHAAPETASPAVTDTPDHPSSSPDETLPAAVTTVSPAVTDVPFVTETIAVTDIVIRETTEASEESDSSEDGDESDSPESTDEGGETTGEGDEDDEKEPVAPSESTDESGEPKETDENGDEKEPAAPSESTDDSDSTASPEDTDTPAASEDDPAQAESDKTEDTTEDKTETITEESESSDSEPASPEETDNRNGESESNE